MQEECNDKSVVIEDDDKKRTEMAIKSDYHMGEKNIEMEIDAEIDA